MKIRHADHLAARSLGALLVGSSALLATALFCMPPPAHLVTVLAGIALLAMSGAFFLMHGVRERIAAALVLLAGVTAASSLAVSSVHEAGIATPLTIAEDDAHCWIDVRGDFAPDLYWRLKDTLDAHRGARAVLLNSPGGIALSIPRVATLLRERGIHTAVAYDQCDSACAFLWVTSPRRQLAARTMNPGFHGPHVTLPWIGLVRAPVQQEQRAYLRDAGLPEAFIDWAYVPLDQVWRPDPRALSGMGVPVEVLREADPHRLQFCNAV